MKVVQNILHQNFYILKGEKMGKIFDFELFTGKKGNLLNINDMLKLVLGVVAMIFATVLGQKVAGMVERAVPGNQTKIAPFVEKQTVASGPVVKKV